MFGLNRLTRPLGALGRRLGAFGRDRRGSVTTMAAILSPVLIGAMGMGGEIGYWYLTSQKLQNAADTAAHGSAIRLGEGDDAAAIQALANLIAEKADIDLGTATVTVNMPPQSGAFIEDSGAVEIIVTETVPRMFSAIYDNTPLQLQARAVARAQDAGTACVLALNASASGALSFNGSATVTGVLCDFVSNSTDAASVTQGGSSFITAGCVRAAGGVSAASLFLDCGTAEENAGTVDDPFAGLAEPSMVGNCEGWDVGNTATPTIVTPTESHPTGMTSIRYCSGLQLKGNVTLMPGLYLVEGGDFRINAGATISGNGVVIFLADGVDTTINGTAQVQLSAPTSGDYNGVLIFSSRSATDESHQINGNSSSHFTGAIYAAASEVDFQGGASTDALGCTQIVADTISFTGNTTLMLHCIFPTGPTIDIGGDIAVVE